jgi:hypothetical protein
MDGVALGRPCCIPRRLCIIITIVKKELDASTMLATTLKVELASF